MPHSSRQQSQYVSGAMLPATAIPVSKKELRDGLNPLGGERSIRGAQGLYRRKL